MNITRISRSALLFALLVPFCQFALAGAPQPEVNFLKDGDLLGKVGDEVNYTFEVSYEAGDEYPSLDCEVEDPMLRIAFDITLDPGQIVREDALYEVQEGDNDPLINEAFVRCTSPDGERWEWQDSHEINLFQPAIAVDKTGDELSKVGDPVDYIIILHNLSSRDTPNMNCVANDSLLGEVFNGVLPPGDTVINISRTVQAGDPDPLINTVTLICSPAGFDNVLEASAVHETNLFQPSGGIAKIGDELSKVGDDVNYSLTLINSSSVDTPAFDCNISDPLLDLDLNVVLVPGESWQEDYRYTVQPGDQDPLVNTMNVLCGIQGFPNQLGGGVSATTNLFQPVVEVIKDGPVSARPGETITYYFTINNYSSADAPDLLLASVLDDVLGDLTAIAVSAGCDRLRAGESCSFSYDYPIPAEATDPHVNVVTVLYNPEGFPSNDISDDDDHAVEIVRTVSVEACKLEDVDGNPATVDDRVPVPGWTVQLTTDGVILDEQLTGDDGCYTWENLDPLPLPNHTDVNGLVPPGYYGVAEVVPPDWYPWTPAQFFCDPIPGGGTCSYTFVNSEKVDVEACKAEDPDGDLSTPEGRSRVVGWPVKLLRNGEVVRTAETGRNGCYRWENLPPAAEPIDPGLDAVRPVTLYRYAVSEKGDVKPGWYPISDEEFRCGPIGSGETCSRTFVNSRYASISGHKWSDLNRNAQWDAPPDPGPVEPALDGWTIQLRTLDGLLAEATTGPSGAYKFSDLEVGKQYFVCEVLMDGYDQTYPGAFDCTRVGGQGYMHVVEPLSGDEIADKDFGNSSCGNGRVDAIAGEQCDDNRTGCCDEACQFQPCGLVTDSALCEFDKEPTKGICSDDGEACVFDPLCSDKGGIVCTADGHCLDVFGNDLGQPCEVADPCLGDCEQSKQFRLNFNPDAQNWVAYRLTASNPGQYYYNVIYDASSHAGALMLEIVVPYPFVTQGAMPLQVFDADLVPSSEKGCPDPQDALMEFPTVITLADWISGVGPTDEPDYLICDQTLLGGTGECIISIMIPESEIAKTTAGLLYIALHLDYGLKGNFVDADDNGYPDRYDRHAYISSWGSSDALFDTEGEDGEVAIADCSTYLFSHAVNGFEDGDSAENLNIFKRPVGVYGSAMCHDGSPLVGWIGLFDSDGQFVQAARVDDEGYFGVDYSHKGKPSYYDLKWCADADCKTLIGESYEQQDPGETGMGFGLQSKGFAEISLIDHSADCDGGGTGNPDWEEAAYFSGKFSNKK